LLNLTYPALLLALLFPVATFAQDAPTPTPATPQTSPKAAYNQALHPLEVTRSSIGNWSDTELAALKVSMAQAAAECSARPAKAYSGEDLIDLVHLCTFGQSWPAVVEAATPYIASTSSTKPRLNQAYAALIDAQLHLKKEPSAFTAAQAMLSAVPYDALSAEIINEAIAYMQFNNTPDAVTLATARQPLLLALLRTLANPPTDTTPAPQSSEQQSIHELYADGLAFAALQQLALQPSASSAATVADLDATLPTTLSPDEAVPISALRRRYAFLGQPLPKLAGTPWPGAEAYLSNPHKLPQIPSPHAITALLLFPDWCAQCVRMGSQFPQSVFTVSGHEAYFYGLLAETVAPLPPPKPNIPPSPATPANAANLLIETPTLAVDPALLGQFAVTDPPFLILTDAQGIIRVLQPVAEDAVAPRSTVDSAIALIGKQWPLINPAIKPVASPIKPQQSR
jgi:hypothetical protein